MKEAYVSYEVAKLLKEKGFDIPSDTSYEDYLWQMYDEDGKVQWGIYSSDWYFRITQQMACRWLREEKGIHPELELCIDNEFSFTIYKLDGKRTVLYEESHCWTKPEDAVDAALLYVFQNLI